MAQATTLNDRRRTLSAPSAIVFLVILATAVVIAAAIFVANLSVETTAQPRSDAVVESGRTWQRQYEQMSGLEAARERYDAAVLQSGRDWEQRYRDMSGQ
jgi:hypothetical protein